MTISRVTVAICTWNRAPLLAQTLEEFTKLSAPASVEWELLVVNNNCTDATDQVIADYERRLPIRRLFEAQPGLSNARNRAVAEASGSHIIWTDDDVLVATDWLDAYCRAFDKWPDAVVFGGPIAPWFPATPPQWLMAAWPRVAKAFAVLDYGSDVLPLSALQLPFGANMAIRTDVQRRLPYDPARGVRPGGRMGGEETAVFEAALSDGASGWWVPNARVRHYIPPERQSPAYLERYYFAYGEYIARYGEFNAGVMLLGRPRWLWRHAARAVLRFAVSRRLRPPAVWIEDLIVASTARGSLHGYKLRASQAAR